MKSPTVNAVACACGGGLVGQSVTYLLCGSTHPAFNLFAGLVGVVVFATNLAAVKYSDEELRLFVAAREWAAACNAQDGSREARDRQATWHARLMECALKIDQT